MKKIKIISLVALLLLVKFCYSQDITLYNSVGEAKAYISASNNYTIFNWDGIPLAYLANGINNNSVNVYSFEGEHLGWLENGILRDHQGKISMFQKGSLTNVSYKLENIKELKKNIPLKNVQKLEPLKPLYQNYFSNNLFESYPTNESSSSSTVDIYKKSQVNPLDYYKPYEPDYNGRMNAINARTEEYFEREAEMLRKGYVKSYTGNTWVTKEEYQNQVTKSKNDENELIRGYFYKRDHPRYGQLREGKYNATLYNGLFGTINFHGKSPSDLNDGLHKTIGLVHVGKKGAVKKLYFYSDYQGKWYKEKFKKTNINYGNDQRAKIECLENGRYRTFYLFID